MADLKGKCPNCGGFIAENSVSFYCRNYKEKGCEFSVWKTIAKRTITKEEVEQLLKNNETDVLEGFVSKKGNEFSARLILEEEEQGKFKVSFSFN